MKLKPLISILPCFAIFACTNSEENSSQDLTVNDTTQLVSEQEENSPILNELSFADDWIEFRNAVVNGNEELVQTFISTDDVDAKTLIEMCTEDWIKEPLSSALYEDLTETDFNGELSKEWSVETIYEVEGEEFGSALFLFLNETEKGLKLTGMLAAG